LKKGEEKLWRIESWGDLNGKPITNFGE